MRKQKRKDRTKKSRDNVVGKILEIDDLRKVTGGRSEHAPDSPPHCREIKCEECVGNRP